MQLALAPATRCIYRVNSRLVMLLVLLTLALLGAFTGVARPDEGHGSSSSAPSAGRAGGTFATITAERNIQNEHGQFTIVLKRSPSDPRSGEVEHFVVILTEKVQGGFGSGPIPLEKAAVTFGIIQSDGSPVAGNFVAREEAGGVYRGSYTFEDNGDFKIIVSVATADNRSFSTDFPVSVTAAPIRTSFWLAFAFLLLLTIGGSYAVLSSLRSRNGTSIRSVAPIGAVIILVFSLVLVALIFLLPPRQTRDTTSIRIEGTAEPEVNALATESVITVPKESQLLFGIKTQTVEMRQITSGVKTTGVVRIRPDARGVVSAQVPGRITFSQSVALGSAVARGEQVGTIEQVFDVSNQTELEAQRLEVEAQQREVEARRMELRNTVLSLRAQQAQISAAAQQARTRLAQAQRELRRSQNLLEVGAAPRKRVEEAQTAVRVAEEEVSGAERQVALLAEQIRSAEAGQAIFRSPTVRRPSRNFPLVSPVTGIIDAVKATSGQQVESGAELLNVVNLSTVLLEAQVFERDLPAIRESTRASFTSPVLPGEVYTIGTPDGEGRLLSIGQSTNEQTRTIPVIYEVKNPFTRLRDGNFVEITIDTSGDRQVLAVPKPAVVREQGESFVFVFDGGETFERRLVALGAEGADFYEVVSGLTEGERVVTEGVYQLRTSQAGA
jgi:HlyD family secretion protein